MHGRLLNPRILAAIALLFAGDALLPDRANGGSGPAIGRIQLVESNAASDRVNTADIDPALLAKLDRAAATYKQLAGADIASAVANVDQMLAALEANDVQTARRAWIDARAAYERCKVLTIKFPYLAGGIDPRLNSKVGFRSIEAKLFAPDAPLPLAESQALSDKVHTFQRVFAAEPIYAHGVMAGIGYRTRELAAKLEKEPSTDKTKGGPSSIGGTSLRDMQNEVEGIEIAWNTIFSTAVREKNGSVADRVETEFAEVRHLLSVGSGDQLDIQALATKSQMLADSISDAVLVLGWKPQRPEEAED
jgi:iron uptake system EfeUOB component EfeO/EfeM